MFKITSVKITGNPNPSGWSQVFEYKPQEEEKLKLRGHFFAVISEKEAKTREAPIGAGTGLLGREIITRLSEEYFGNTEKSAFNALKDAVQRIMDEFSSEENKIEIAAASFLDATVYSACGGGGRAEIVREGTVARILESENESAIVASGHPQKGDVFLLGTKAFFLTLPSGLIKANLENGDLDLAAEVFTPLIHSGLDTELSGAVIIKFDEEAFFAPSVNKEGGANKIFNKFREKTLSALDKILERFQKKKIYVKESFSDVESGIKRKNSLTIGVLLIALLLVSVVFGIRQKKSKEARSRYEGVLSSANHEFNEALELYSLNPARARELFVQSRQKISELKDQNITDKAIDELARNIDEKQGEILGEYQADPELFVDLSVITDNFEGDKLVLSEGRLYVLDKKSAKIIKVDISTKKTRVIAGPDMVSGAQDLAAYLDRVFTLTKEGIFEVVDKKSLVIENSYQEGALPYVFAGNFYILDKASSEITRYQSRDESFAPKQSWLTAGIKPDFGNIISWSIDGSVWLLSKTGKVFKYTLGNQADFNAQDISPPLLNPNAIYTSGDEKYVYVLEREGKRVVILSKEGGYKGQYISDKIAEAGDLAISEEEKKIILLAGGKLYSIEVKHQ